MAAYSQRPENALKRANEFIEDGRPKRALDTLYEVFRNEKWAYNWSESVLEPIMIKYLDLCVELKESHIAKEGLFQYRNMFQTVNVGSLEHVIHGYLRSAEKKTEAARENYHQAVLDIGDLDNLTPGSLLVSAVSGEGAEDRNYRTILAPWVKFLWESYCHCLDLLRTKALVEGLYHDIAKMAYSFCLKFNRKTEFRKLCDKLRKHLEDIAKLPAQPVNNVNLSRPETQQYNLDTRLTLLDYAIQMELWQEAYKVTEDIHNLMSMSKKPTHPKVMTNYYQKLGLVFWKAGPAYYLFHAAALFKFYQLNKEMKNITSEELQRMANRVLLATLSIPLPSAHPEFDRFIEKDKTPIEKAQKLAALLSLNQPPTRSSLIKDIVRYSVRDTASSKLQQLYTCLELTFNPLQLCKKVDAIINEIKDIEQNMQYIAPLRDVTLVTLIKQASQVYETISYSRLLDLSSFATQFQIERLIVECVRHNDMQIRIDHAKGVVYFGIDLTDSQRENKTDGPVIQDMPSEQIRTYLMNMYEVLTKCQRTINPSFETKAQDDLHALMVRHYHEIEYREHQKVLQRHKIIEERKEYIKQMNTVRYTSPVFRQDRTREAEELQKERKEQQVKLKAQEKKLDYFERAKRTEEIPLLKQAWKEKQIADRKFWDQQEADGILLLKQDRKLALQHRERINRNLARPQAIQQAIAEQKRLQQKRKERKKRRVKNELQQIRDRTLKKKMAHDKKIWENLQDAELENLDADRIREAEELQNEPFCLFKFQVSSFLFRIYSLQCTIYRVNWRDTSSKRAKELNAQETELDYFERAKRLEEIPLLEEAWKEKQIADQKYWDQQEADRILLLKQDQKLASQHRELANRMDADLKVFMAKLKERRTIYYQDQIKEFEKKLEIRRKECLEERKKERFEQRRAAYIKRIEKDERLKREQKEKEARAERKK